MSATFQGLQDTGVVSPSPLLVEGRRSLGNGSLQIFFVVKAILQEVAFELGQTPVLCHTLFLLPDMFSVLT